MIDFAALVDKYGPPVVIVAFVLYVLYKERGQILALFHRRQALVEKRETEDLTFESKAREKLLANGDYSRDLVDRLLDVHKSQMDRIMLLYESERQTNRTLSSELLDAQASSVSVQMIEVIQDIANVIRIQADRAEEARQAHAAAYAEAVATNSALLVVLNRLYGVNRSDVAEVLAGLENEEA